jgi:type IV secretion system protein VirB10
MIMSEAKDQSNQTQEDEKNDGLPDIVTDNKKSPIVFLALALIAVFGIYYISHHHSASTTNTTADETFNIQNGQQAPELNTQKSTTQSNTNSQPSTENNDDAQKALAARIQAPMMLVDQNQSNNLSATQTLTTSPNSSNNQNNQSMNQISGQDSEPVEATQLQHRNYLIAQGNLIHAVLETAINSDLPGYLRAIVSEPVYSEDGSQVLITPGSRLIGQYKSGIQQGQSRVFIVWTRLIEPNGISVQLGSPGVDNLGTAGQAADAIDYHFWQMFGTASLLSVLGAGASNAGVSSDDQNNASQAYREAMASSLNQTAQNSLQSNTAIPPTLHVNQGAAVMVFVARDLSFVSKYFFCKENLNSF